MVRKRIIALAVVVVVIVVAAGFVVYYYNAYHKLNFTLNGASLGSVSLTSVQTYFTLGIHNPNLLPVYIPSGSYQVYVNNQYFGRGTFGSLTVGGNSQDQITVPLIVSALSVGSTIYGLITGGGSVTITLQGSANLFLFTVPFKTTVYNAKFT